MAYDLYAKFRIFIFLLNLPKLYELYRDHLNIFKTYLKVHPIMKITIEIQLQRNTEVVVHLFAYHPNQINIAKI